MSKVTVRLDQYQYYPGNTIRGEAICYFRSPKEFRKIRIRLHGHEHTSWSKSESYYDYSAKQQRTRTIQCVGDNDIVLRDDIVQGEGRLPSGEHVFPIEFTLPNDVPSTFECRYGGIDYSIKVTVDRAFITDIEDARAFKVFSPVILPNIQPFLLKPHELSDEKTVCCWCCAGGNIEMHVSLDTRTFVVGKSGNIKVYCLNMSNNNVDELNVEIVQHLICKTTMPSDSQYDTELITTSHNSGVGAHGDKTYNLSLEIPSSAAVPNFSRSTLFECNYTLKVNAVVSGCHTDIDLKTDVALSHDPVPNLRQAHSQCQGGKESSWESIDEYVEEGPIINQPMPMPMPMPMPSEMYGFRVPPYSPSNISAPSAPQAEAPSAPPNMGIGEINSDPGNTSAMDPPPPSYDQATEGSKAPKQ